MPPPKRSDPTTDPLNTAMQQWLSQAFGRFAPNQAWSPNVNLYQLRGRLVVCADLAGVDREHVSVRVEPGCLEIRGERPAPNPARDPGAGDEPRVRILTMEIDDGAFQRRLPLPRNVALDRVESTYREGMLWVILPLNE